MRRSEATDIVLDAKRNEGLSLAGTEQEPRVQVMFDEKFLPYTW